MTDNENNMLIQSNDVTQQDNKKGSNGKNKYTIFFIVIIVVLIASVSFNIYIFMQNKSLSEKLVLLNDRITLLDAELDRNIKVLHTSIKEIDDLNEYSLIGLIRLQLSQSVDSGIVNDQLVIDKSIFYDRVAFIDVDTQPIMSSQYKGNGNFSTDDRELKKTLLNLIEQLKVRYNEYKYGDMINFEDMTINITIKNYDIGTYEKGVLTLTGE